MPLRNPSAGYTDAEAIASVEDETALALVGPVTIASSLDIVHTSTEADDHAFEIDLDAAGFGDVKAADIDYITGAIEAGEDEGIILINIDEILAAGGDIFALEVLATEGLASIYRMKTGVGIGPVHQDSGAFATPTTGIDNGDDASAMYDDNPNTTTAIFEAKDEYIIIGADAAFEELEFILAVGSSGGGIKPTFAYSTGGANFTPFSPVDGTNGFRNTGVVAWDQGDLTNHAVSENGTFDIKITRTRVALGTTPVLRYAKTAATTEYVWDKDGNVDVLKLSTDTIEGRTSGAGVTIDGILFKGDTADPGDVGAIPVTHSGHVALVTAGGAQTRTLADAVSPGLTLDLYFKTDAGDCVVTAASPINQNGDTVMTFSAVGQFIRLVSIEDGADFEWRVAANDGVGLA